jgi:hypothetical protein
MMQDILTFAKSNIAALIPQWLPKTPKHLLLSSDPTSITIAVIVKTEFGKFGGILDKVSKKLQETQNVIDVEVGRRRRPMDRKLKGVEVLPRD